MIEKCYQQKSLLRIW